MCFFLENSSAHVVRHTSARPRKKKAYVRLTQDYDALDVANRIGFPAAICSLNGWLIFVDA